MPTREFTREELEDLGIPHEADSSIVLRNEQIDSGRWESYHECVFRAPDDGKTWRVTYSEGLTEYQDADRWDDEGVVTATEVEPYEVTVTKWKKVV